MFNPNQLQDYSLKLHITHQNIATPLYYASHIGLATLIKLLLEKGANVNIICKGHGNPLQVAAYYGYKEVVECLLKYGANCSVRSRYYSNALQAVRYASYQLIVQILSQATACQNIPTAKPNGFKEKLRNHITFKKQELVPFKVLNLLRVGNCGIIKKVKSLADSRVCVRKTIRTPREQAKLAFVEEVCIIQKLKHQHVVEVLGSYTCGAQLLVLMLLIANCNLTKFMTNADCSSTNTIASKMLIKQLACPSNRLFYIHSTNIKHKDIKP